MQSGHYVLCCHYCLILINPPSACIVFKSKVSSALNISHLAINKYRIWYIYFELRRLAGKYAVKARIGKSIMGTGVKRIIGGTGPSAEHDGPAPGWECGPASLFSASAPQLQPMLAASLQLLHLPLSPEGGQEGTWLRPSHLPGSASASPAQWEQPVKQISGGK